MEKINYQKKIADILRSDQETIADLEEVLGTVTGKVGVLESIVETNERLISERLKILGVSRQAGADDIYSALNKKVESDDRKIFDILGKPQMSNPEDNKRVIEAVAKTFPNKKGFFMKKEKAREFLIAEPPKNILRALGYKSAEAMLDKEDLLEVYSALRFLEDRKWLNEKFFKQHESLKPEDFEVRDIEVKALSIKWAKTAEKFVRKKYHNVSHLKELGVIFIIPISLGVAGETLRLFLLLSHYFNEVHFYSSVFQSFNSQFAEKVISLLRGDVLEELPLGSDIEGKNRFLVIQRYLAKEDENDHRLFEPHINPEAVHWTRAEKALTELDGFSFWQDLDWVGDYFKSKNGEALVSFNLVDTVMGFVMAKHTIKYLYHHQEALWNKIFISYLGEEKVETLMKENMIRGYFEI